MVQGFGGKTFGDFFGGASTLEVDGSGRPTAEALQLAAALLMVAVVRGTKHENAEEELAMYQNIEREFHLTPERAARLLEIAGSAKRDETELLHCMESINASFNEPQKQRILAMIWRVIVSDGVVDQFESEFAAAVRTHLGLTLEQAIRARRLAEGGGDLTIQEKVDD